jgi:hypothetical protein
MSGKNQLPTFHAIPVRPKPTFSIPSHSSQSNIANTFFLLSLLCRSWSPNYSVHVLGHFGSFLSKMDFARIVFFLFMTHMM